VQGWRSGLTNALTQLFSYNKDASEMDGHFGRLTSLIANGQQIEGSDSVPDLTVTQLREFSERAIFTALIPAAWRILKLYPVVIDSGFACGATGPLDHKYMLPDTGNNAWACDADGKKLYYLLGTTAKYSAPPCQCGSPCFGPTPPLCPPPSYFKSLPGIEELVLKPAAQPGVMHNDWASITREDLIIG